MAATFLLHTLLHYSAMADPNAHVSPKLELDADLYRPDDNQVAFTKKTTGIQDDDELKEHILAMQKEAFAIHAVRATFMSKY